MSSKDELFWSTQVLHVKFTVNSANIVHGLHIVNFGFTILEEGSVVKAASGNHMCILREPEQYDQLVLGLQDIGKEVALISKKDINVVIINVCGDCSLSWRWLEIFGVDLMPPILIPPSHLSGFEDVERGARTLESMIASSKLPKWLTQKHNRSHEPLFPTIPIHYVIVNLHLLIRVMDTLMNLRYPSTVKAGWNWTRNSSIPQ